MSLPERSLLPPLACDTHSHVYGDSQVFPLRAGHAIQRASGLDDYLKISRGLGVHRHVLVQGQAYGTDTRRLIQALANIGIERARGIIFPDHSQTAEDLAQLHLLGIRGVRFLYGPGTAVDTAAILTTAHRIAPLQWSVLVQAPAIALEAAFEALHQGDCPVVIDHMGRVPPDMGTDDHTLQALLRFLGRGDWIKLSAPYYGNDNGMSDFHALRSRVDAFFDAAGDRVIWGMNWPHPSLPAHQKPDECATLRSLLAILSGASGQKTLFVDNPARLYGFNGMPGGECSFAP